MSKIVYALIIGSIVIIALLAGCAAAPPTSPTVAPPLSHPIDLLYQNCNACHLHDEMTATPFPHFGSQGFEFTNSECTAPGCHPLQPSS
jgi:hypothetical protein